MRLPLPWLITVLVLRAFTASAGAPCTIDGKVNFQGKPLEGAVVSLYSSADHGFRETPAYRLPATGPDGFFQISTDPGTYFLLARKSVSGSQTAPAPGDYYAFYGGNPVVIGAGQTIHVGINASPILAVESPSVPGGTGIRGRVFSEGKPLARARVVLYQDGDTIFRGIGYASVFTDPKGRFSINLEPGEYYVIARKRIGEDRMGPLKAGDLFAFTPDNPVQVKDGAFSVVALNAVTKLQKVKQAGQAVTLGGTVKAGTTVIRGTIRDRDTRPVAGVYVGAYRDSMMIYKPDFISNRTGADGRFTLQLGEGGEYFLLARDTIGGPAEKGDQLGRYAGNEDHSVVLKTGQEVDGIDIVVEEVQ